MFFSHKNKTKLTSGGRIPSEMASQEEQNGEKFSFIAPSCEELWVWKEVVDYI